MSPKQKSPKQFLKVLILQNNFYFIYFTTGQIRMFRISPLAVLAFPVLLLVNSGPWFDLHSPAVSFGASSLSRHRIQFLELFDSVFLWSLKCPPQLKHMEASTKPSARVKIWILMLMQKLYQNMDGGISFCLKMRVFFFSFKWLWEWEIQMNVDKLRQWALTWWSHVWERETLLLLSVIGIEQSKWLKESNKGEKWL